jgi:hypothetical protein
MLIDREERCWEVGANFDEIFSKNFEISVSKAMETFLLT